MSASARGWGSAAIVTVPRRTPSGTELTADAHRTGACQLPQNGGVRKRIPKLFYFIFILVAVLMLLVGTASASFAFTNFASYGKANISYNDTYTVVKWNITGVDKWVATGNVTADTVIEYVVVGGGGSGGRRNAGGGGAGAYWEGTTTVVPGIIYNITVGAGGASQSVTNGLGYRGGNSTLFNTSIGSPITGILANGGAAGGSRLLYPPPGGSGGGGGTPNLASPWIQNGSASNQPGHGNYGGDGKASTTLYAAGGGGGAISNGSSGVITPAAIGGAGGQATYTMITGTPLVLAGGGGGMPGSGTAGAGGKNTTLGITVGGVGSIAGTAGTAGVAATGSGGGGSSTASGAGGSGVVIIRYPAITVTSLNVTTGSTGGGTAVNITGAGFTAGAGTNSVFIGGNAATIIGSPTNTSIIVTTPSSGTAGATWVNISNQRGQFVNMSNAYYLCAALSGVHQNLSNFRKYKWRHHSNHHRDEPYRSD